MKKRTLTEELERIHTITYGEKLIKESNFLSTLMSTSPEKKTTDPTKADEVTDDVKSFYQNLEDAIKAGGLSQQSGSGLTYQKEVESMQIGLMTLGYDLPRHGVDGLFGPETAAAVSKFTTEKVGNTQNGGTTKPMNESVKLVSQGGNIIGKPGQGTHNVSGWQSRNAWDVTGPVGTEVYSLTNGSVTKIIKGGSGVKTTADGKRIYGDQLAITSSDGKPDVFYTHIETNLNVGDKVKEGDVVGKIIQGGGIDPHVHVGISSGNLDDLATGINGGTGGTTGAAVTKATPEMLTKLMELLKEKPLTSDDLKKHINMVTSGGGAAFTDLDLTTEDGYMKYATICQKFIDSRPPNLLNIKGEMLATAARTAFERYHKYVPPELALAQLVTEGGIGNANPQSRPIRTRNPYNVGNTDNGSNVSHNSVESGIQTYYDLMARNYLGNGKTASDLIQNFVNKDNQRYASAGNYEQVLNKIAGEANRIGQTVVPRSNVDMSNMA